MSHLNIVLRIIYILVNIIWLRTLLAVLRSSIPLQALFTEIIILNYLISRPFFHSWSHILFRKPYVNSIILSRHIDVKMFIYFCIFLQRAVEHTTTTPQSVSFTQELVAGELSQQMFLWVALIESLLEMALLGQSYIFLSHFLHLQNHSENSQEVRPDHWPVGSVSQPPRLSPVTAKPSTRVHQVCV